MVLNIYGRNPVLEAVKSAFKVEEIWIARSSEGRVVSQIKHQAEKKAIPIKVVSKNELQKMAGAVVHQGVTARITDYAPIDKGAFYRIIEQKKHPAIVILDQIQDPHNLGAILRTAEVAGIDAVVLPVKNSAGVNETIAKTSAGALFHVPVYYCDKLDTLLAELSGLGLATLAAVTGQQYMIYEADMTQGVAMVIGSEGKGVRKNIAALCSEKISIPQAGKIGSLNASVAAAILMFEMVRQRSYVKD